ncbi:MAG: transketolase [Planctomycetes bacterium]|nr:transketolase [Planctomycetota bacterium]
MSHSIPRDLLCINTLRALSIDAVEKANSGHPGLPLGAAPMAYTLWQGHLKFDAKDPKWHDRDRFVLSAGHGSMLVYSLLHLYGFELSMEELKNFRQWGSRTPGHPEYGMTSGVEATTGPLGQGSANAVGMAMAERFLAARFNRPDFELVNHHTFALVSDGDLMEGLSHEAASLAGHLKLGKLIYLYDANDVSLDGPCSLAFSEDVGKRFEAYGWQVLFVQDGNRDVLALDRALRAAKAESARPSLILVKTTIGFGSPKKAGTAAAHGSPLGKDEVAATKKALGWEAPGDFYVPEEAREHFRAAGARGAATHAQWNELFAAYAKAHPELAAEWKRAWAGEYATGWDAGAPKFDPSAKVATRTAGGKALNAFAAKIPHLFGGDADLSGSTKTALDKELDFDGRTGQGRNVRFGVREHAMGAIANGIAYHGGARTYTATFFAFADYMRPAIRLAAMNHLPVSFVFTHDSIGLGEDGPTHQPVEHLASLRAMPNLLVLRPADATETTECWKIALKEQKRPAAIVLSRQDLPVLDRTKFPSSELVKRGAYVLAEPPAGLALRALLIATGSEVSLALAAQKELATHKLGARVVSMPSWELFEEQDEAYRASVLPPELSARVSIEAGATFGWTRWIGERGVAIGLDRFGGSAPANVLYDKLGFSVERIVRTVRSLVNDTVLAGR